MSQSTALVIVGALLILVGLAKAGQSGGFRLSNFGINFGGTTSMTSKVGNVTQGPAKGGKPDWVGLGIAAIGLVTAVVGLFKS